MLLHLTVGPARETHKEALQKAIKCADSWTEYVEGCWLISSELSVPEWYGLIKPILGNGPIFFIHKIEEHEFVGCLPGWASEWLRERSKLSA